MTRHFILCVFIISIWANLGVAQNYLFQNEVKQSTPYSYVYSFIERYMRELSQIKDSNNLRRKLKDDKVIFLKGEQKDISLLNDSTRFTLDRIEDKYYIATWADSVNTDLISISFPNSYELLLGYPKSEIELHLEELILSADSSDYSTNLELEPIDSIIYRTNPQCNYYITALNDVRYYRFLDQSSFIPLWDSIYTEYSVLNLFKVDVCPNITMNVTQSVYGFNNLIYSVPISQWINYCHNAGLTIYSGIEEETDDKYKLVIICECKELSYNHVISAYIPKDIEAIKDGIDVTINAYIPNHNIKNLFQQ